MKRKVRQTRTLRIKEIMNKNDIVDIVITDISNTGSGVGRYEGVTVFVPETAIGDRVAVKIVKVKKNYCFGRLAGIVSPSEDRIASDCAQFPKCGGCVYRHISYEAECKIKENEVYNCIKRIGGIEMPPESIVAAETPFRYRNKAQYPIDECGKLGFYATHSHRVIPHNDCLLQPEEFALAKSAVEEWIDKANVSIYSEENKKGLCRHFYLRKGFKSGEIMAVLVINGNSIPKAQLLIETLKSSLGENLKSVCLNINKEDNNVVLGKENICIYGDGFINDTLSGVDVRLSPNSFYQVNRGMAERLYGIAKRYAEPKGKTVLDLYCGAGTIGLSMADEAKWIIGVEIVPDAVEDAKRNAETHGIANAEFICGDAKAAAERLRERKIKPDVVIVDPPRKGCEKELLCIIAQDFSPEKIVYVSCDPATLARDTAILTKLGYNLIEYTPVDLFPRTAHVETVALLSRQKVDEHIYFDVNVGDLPKTTRTTATYPEIKAYVKDKYGLCVSSLNIAQVKENHGFEKRANYNKGKDGHRVPNCTPEKEKAIEDAFKHFGMI